MSIILFNMHLLSANYVLGMTLDPLWLGWAIQRRVKESSAHQELTFLRGILTYNENISIDLRECRARRMHKIL